MKKVLSSVVIAAILAFAPTADAQVALDFTVGYSIPFGNAENPSPAISGYVPMSDAWTGAIPIGVAGRYRFTPNISAGVYFQWGPAFVSTTTCIATASCSGSEMRVGLQLVYDFIPGETMNPWFSLGTGWEWTHYSVTSSGQTDSVTWSGWETVNVQTGLDFALSKRFALGPYVGYSGGIYSNVFASGPGKDGYGGAVALSSRSFHSWVQFGLKGTLNL